MNQLTNNRSCESFLANRVHHRLALVLNQKGNQNMLWEDSRVRKRIESIISKMGARSQNGSELFQETIVHLWCIELIRPGQKQAWYLQSCRYFLQHKLHGDYHMEPKRRPFRLN